jgi:hypothetical protein
MSATNYFVDLDALIECYKSDPSMTRDKWAQWARECADHVAHLKELAVAADAVRDAAAYAARAAAAAYAAERKWQTLRLMEIFGVEGS